MFVSFMLHLCFELGACPNVPSHKAVAVGTDDVVALVEPFILGAEAANFALKAV